MQDHEAQFYVLEKNLMDKLVNKYLLIFFLSISVSLLSILKINNVHELRILNSNLDFEKSRELLLESRFIELNNKLLYKKSFIEANKKSQINLAMIKPSEIKILKLRVENEN